MSGEAFDRAGGAVEVCGRFPLEDEARKLLREGMTARQFLGVLLEHGQYPDASRFLAHFLPKREAVWWACRCVRLVAPPGGGPGEAALTAAEQWAAEPTEERRRAAFAAAEAAGFGNPAGCAAAAAFWSGGSLAPPNLPAVSPGDHLTPTAVANAVVLAAVAREPEKAADKSRRFFAVGVEIAAGRERWKEERPVAARAPLR
jgi:hypothetical protein